MFSDIVLTVVKNPWTCFNFGNKTKRFLTGDDLLSQGASPQVPSALEGLTSWFGMEQGVSPPLLSPEEPYLP